MGELVEILGSSAVGRAGHSNSDFNHLQSIIVYIMYYYVINFYIVIMVVSDKSLQHVATGLVLASVIFRLSGKARVQRCGFTSLSGRRAAT